jgi:hypothetical protein
METKFTRKLNDLESAFSNFRDALTLDPRIARITVTSSVENIIWNNQHIATIIRRNFMHEITSFISPTVSISNLDLSPIRGTVFPVFIPKA